MAFGKWNQNGTLSWSDGQVLYAADLNDTIDETVPMIGAIVAWLKSLSGSIPQTLPVGWVECDGSVISDTDSPFNGDTIPDLNGSEYFLSGSGGSTTTGGASIHSHSINASGVQARNNTGTPNRPTTPTNASASLPPYYKVVWITRIK